MIFEVTIKYVTQNKKGDDVNVKEKYIISNAASFGDAENIITQEFGCYAGFEVVAIKISTLKEIANSRDTGEEKVFIATVTDIFTTDEGEERETTYKVAFFSKDMSGAYSFAREYFSQGYNLSIDGIKKSNFIDII